VDTTSGYGQPGATLQALEISLDQIAELVGDEERSRLEMIRLKSRELSAALTPLLLTRRATGKVRECHGDLHIGNVVEVDGRLTPFDCLEFDPGLRWLDVLSDVAFLAMDLLAHQRPELAYAFMNAWLEASGDYESLPLYNFFSLYRAVVRAMAERLRHTGNDQRYLQLLDYYLSPDARRPQLMLTCGVSGTGKTWLSTRLLAKMPGIRVRSDVERKRLAGLSATASSKSLPGSGIYTKDYTERTYARLEACAKIILQGGEHAIIDAACLRRAERERIVAIAQAAGATAHIVHCTAPTDVLRQRIMARQAQAQDASEATVAVLEQQLAWWEPLSAEEEAIAIEVDTSRAESVDVALSRLGKSG
jgi:predicted kinase